MWKNYRQQESGKERTLSKTIVRIEYSKYSFSIREMVLYLVEGILMISVVGYFFYRSVQVTLLLLPAIAVFFKKKQRELCEKRKQELTYQFKDALNAINNSLQAGYSMENAFVEGYRDMVHDHGMESIIAKELFCIKTGLQNNQNLEELVRDLGNRSKVEDIQDFADVLAIGKRSGGNICEIMKSCISVIEEKILTKQEIQTLISSRKFEIKIMSAIPFLIILYIDLTSHGYFDALYQTISGRIIMTGCLVVYLMAIYLSHKIMDINI